MSFGASAPGMSTAPIVRSASLIDSSSWSADDMRSWTRPAQDLLEEAHAVDRALEDRHLRAHAERDDGGVVADHPAADHEHARRRDAGDAAEQDPAAALRLLELIRARLRRRADPAISLIGASSGSAPRSVSTVSYAIAVIPESTSARVSGSSAAMWRYVKSVRPSRSRGYSDAIGSLTLSSRSARAQTSSTEAIVAPARSYASSGNALPTPAPVSTSDLVAALDELARTGRRQRDAVLLRLDLLGDTDPHGAAIYRFPGVTYP